MEMLITRKEAIQNGLKRYFTGVPCKFGHFSERQTSDRQCCECKINNYKKNKKTDKFKEWKKNYSKTEVYKICKKGCDKRYKDKNKLKNAEYKKKYKKTAKGIESEKRYLNGKTYNSKAAKIKRLATKSASEAKRRVSKYSKISNYFKEEILNIYIKCKQMGNEYQVDHIYPINAVGSCGLHVPWNLQIITKEENIKKSNKILQ